MDAGDNEELSVVPNNTEGSQLSLESEVNQEVGLNFKRICRLST